MGTTKRLREDVVAGPDRVDQKAGILRGCALLGSNSANDRVYTKRALEQAAALYPGRPVRIDHKPGTKRSITDDVGTVTRAAVQDGKVRGDVELNLSHPLAKFILERAVKFPETFGFSHEADGLVEEAAGGVERVLEVIAVESVDLVSTPATNRGLFESKQTNAYDVRRLFSDHGYEPTAIEFQTCSELPPGYRDSYIDTLREVAQQRLNQAEDGWIREKTFGIPTAETLQARSQSQASEKAKTDAHQRFVNDLRGVDTDQPTGEFGDLVDGFRRGLR